MRGKEAVKCDDEKDRGGVVNSRQEQLVELSGSRRETRGSRPEAARVLYGDSWEERRIAIVAGTIMAVGHEARLSNCLASSALDGRNRLPLFELRQRHFTSANAEFVYFNAEVGPRQWPCFVWLIPKAQPAAFSSARHLLLVLRLEKLDSVNCTKADVFE